MNSHFCQHKTEGLSKEVAINFSSNSHQPWRWSSCTENNLSLISTCTITFKNITCVIIKAMERKIHSFLLAHSERQNASTVPSKYCLWLSFHQFTVLVLLTWHNQFFSHFRMFNNKSSWTIDTFNYQTLANKPLVWYGAHDVNLKHNWNWLKHRVSRNLVNLYQYLGWRLLISSVCAMTGH